MDNKIIKAEAKGILDYNIKRIYGLSFNKYPYLYKVLRGDLGKFLKGIINFWRSKDSAILSINRQPVYFLGTQKGTFEVRKRMTTGVTNKWLNFLCAIGLLNKIEQKVIEEPYRRVLRNLTGVNRNMLSYNYDLDIEPINTFSVDKYTSEFLKMCNDNAKVLQEHGVTCGNISYIQLSLNGLKDIAIRVYKEDRILSENKNLREFEVVENCIDVLIEDKGYTTKEEICDCLPFSKNEIDKLFKVFKNYLWETRTYKRPTKQEKELYNLKNDCWIIQNKIKE